MTAPPEARKRGWMLLLPPAVALIAAAGYTEWQARAARESAAALCREIMPGDDIQKFVKLALAAEFHVEDVGAASTLVTAHKDVMRINREIYACEVTRKDGKVETAQATMKYAD